MRRFAAVLAALALAGCASSSRPMESATLTLFGPEPRLDAWKTSVVDGLHVHPSSESDPCSVAFLNALAGDVTTGLGTARKGEVAELTRAMEKLCPTFYGPSYGGRDRLALVLRRFPEGGSLADEALVVVLPRLKSGETDRLFRAGEFTATLERPLKTAEAALDRGWVRAFRAPGGRMEFELFLVLKPVRPGASYESLQVITRVDAPAR
jgi:hypothetical protein